MSQKQLLHVHKWSLVSYIDFEYFLEEKNCYLYFLDCKLFRFMIYLACVNILCKEMLNCLCYWRISYFLCGLYISAHVCNNHLAQNFLPSTSPHTNYISQFQLHDYKIHELLSVWLVTATAKFPLYKLSVWTWQLLVSGCLEWVWFLSLKYIFRGCHFLNVYTHTPIRHILITTGSSVSTDKHANQSLFKTGKYHEFLNAKCTCTLATETRNTASNDNKHLPLLTC